LVADEVIVPSHVRHRREDGRKASTLRPAQCCFQNLAVLLFSTAIVFGRTLLQSFDQVIGQISDDELRHVHFPILLLSMIAMP
jgi:hypothetical protein